MPKINGAGEPSYAGHEGVVENALGERHELDPSRNDDGTVKDGFESDERDLSDREQDLAVSDRPVSLEEIEQQKAEREQGEKDERTDTEREADENAARSRAELAEKDKEVKPFPGNSSSASATKREPSSKRSSAQK